MYKVHDTEGTGVPVILKICASHRASVESVRSTVKETDTDYVPLDNERGLGFDSPLVSDARFHRWFGTEDLHLPRKKDHGGLNPSPPTITGD